MKRSRKNAPDQKEIVCTKGYVLRQREWDKHPDCLDDECKHQDECEPNKRKKMKHEPDAG